MAALMHLRKSGRAASSLLSAAKCFSTTPAAERKVAVLGAAGKLMNASHARASSVPFEDLQERSNRPGVL